MVAVLWYTRYALNAVNARWGNLLDAVYGSNVLPETGGATKKGPKGEAYNPARGAKVFDYAHSFLDDTVPLADAGYGQVVAFTVDAAGALQAVLDGGRSTVLRDPRRFVGFRRQGGGVTSVLLRHNGLHIELRINRSHPIGRTHRAGVFAVMLEAAATVIADMEDSVAAVDGEDKALVYRNFAGLMRGDLSADLGKGRKPRTLRGDFEWEAANNAGTAVRLPGRAVILVRNVGLHMFTDAVTTRDGEEVPEGLLDLWVSALAALHDLRKGDGELRNSRTRSVYIVKPKMHGPEEVAFTVKTMAAAEKALGLDKYTLKLGIMDEERRTTVNLKACMAAEGVNHRVVFINTGFLDRTGDEIHTSMEAGPVIPKTHIASAAWRVAYEAWNVDVGLETGLDTRGQIGKGMWAEPDNLAAMVASKIGHPKAGASCAWVPSPTAATLHALHYHQVSVAEVQRHLRDTRTRNVEEALAAILQPPLAASSSSIAAKDVDMELANSAQGILGYVVRWIEHGVGCSKVPDVHNVGLMEDRATLRISSQFVANWLRHGVVSKARVVAEFQKWAAVVDKQNADDAAYRPMAEDLDNSIPYQAALQLVFDGLKLPNGYTEPVLHASRRAEKAKLAAESRL